MVDTRVPTKNDDDERKSGDHDLGPRRLATIPEEDPTRPGKPNRRRGDRDRDLEFDATVEVVPRRSLPLSQVGAEVASGVDADPRVAKDVVLAAATDADLPAETGKRRRGIIDRRGPSRRRLEGRNIREDQGREKDGNTPAPVVPLPRLKSA